MVQSKSAFTVWQLSRKSVSVKFSEGAYQVLKSCQKEPQRRTNASPPAVGLAGKVTSTIRWELGKSSKMTGKGMVAASSVCI